MQMLRETGRFAIAVTLATTVVAADGDSVPEFSARLSADRESLQGRSCEISTFPEPLPDIATIVDEDTLRRAIAAELSGFPASGPMLFSIRFARDGRTEWLEPIRTEAVDVRLRSRVQRLVGERLKPQPPASEPWSLRLQVAAGDSIQLRLSRSEVCPVELIAERLSSAGGSLGLMDREELTELQRAGPVTVEVDVSPTGRALGVALLRSSGSRVVDDQALKTAREARYRPAMIDGIPVAGKYEFATRTRVRVR